MENPEVATVVNEWHTASKKLMPNTCNKIVRATIKLNYTAAIMRVTCFPLVVKLILDKSDISTR